MFKALLATLCKTIELDLCEEIAHGDRQLWYRVCVVCCDVTAFVLLAAGIPYFVGKTARLDVPDLTFFE
jgi:hypothetical protein